MEPNSSPCSFLFSSVLHVKTPPKKKTGWHLDPLKFTTEAPCPDYGFLGYFINVRNLPGDTGGETVGHEDLQLIRFFLAKNISVSVLSVGECLTKTWSMFHLSLPYVAAHVPCCFCPLRTAHQTYRKITVPPCHRSLVKVQNKNDVCSLTSRTLKVTDTHVAFRILIGESLCKRQHLRCSV